MNYRVATVGVVPADVSGEELRFLLNLRAGVHGLKSEPARCLQAMSPVDLDSSLPQRCYLDHFSEELAEARRSPEFVRRALVEQTILAKRAISVLMIRLSTADSIEATSAYSAAITRLQGELRRNLRCIAELPIDEEYALPVARTSSEQELLQKLVPQHEQSCGSETAPDGERIDADTELGSKEGTRQGRVTEAKNPRRVEAGKRNRALRRGITATGRQRLKDAIMRHKPWLKTCGPKTPEGKRQAARNGLRGKTTSMRQIDRELKFLQSLVDSMRKSWLLFEEWRQRTSGVLDRDVQFVSSEIETGFPNPESSRIS